MQVFDREILRILQFCEGAIIIKMKHLSAFNHWPPIHIYRINSAFRCAVKQVSQRVVDRLHGRMFQVDQQEIRLRTWRYPAESTRPITIVC